MLDVWCSADGETKWKDEDELEAAIRTGRFTHAEAADIRVEGQRVYDAMLAKSPPFDGSSWLDWAPDPSWPLPTLPAWARELEGQPTRDLF